MINKLFKRKKDIDMAQRQSSPFEKSAAPGLSGVKYIIAVASGKGGVGKSTVSVNLAIALKHKGFTVGLMDADVYGPSQPGMLGSTNKPDVTENYLKPVNRHGVDFISMGLLVGDDTPVIWRAPIAMKMINQFIHSVAWGDLDYLLIDLPPGTGDVQLTLAQQASLTGAVIVTTPQQVALGVAKKGLRMFEQVKVPVVGIIENMSGFTCAHCGKETAIFKEGGGKHMSEVLGVPYLGSLPLDPEIMMSGDDGVPVLTKSTDSPAAKALISLADTVHEKVSEVAAEINKTEPRQIEIDKDGNLHILWPDDHKAVYSPYHLRLNCACAECVDEDTGRKILDKKSVPLDIKINGYNPVGHYGLSIGFSDGHNTGIYIYDRLRKLCECADCSENTKDDAFSV